SGAKEIEELEDAFNQMVEQFQSFTGEINRATSSNQESEPIEIESGTVTESIQSSEAVIQTAVTAEQEQKSELDTAWFIEEEELPKGLNQTTLVQITQFLQANRRPLSSEDVAEGVKLTRVTVRRYLEFLEDRGVLISKLKYGIGRPVKLFIPS
nr:HTH domain-containing protein [Desulfitobacterium hafniense]